MRSNVLASFVLLMYPLAAHADEEKHRHEEHNDYPEVAVFLGGDVSPAFRKEGMSWVGFHVELEIKMAPRHAIGISLGSDYLLPPEKGEPPEKPVVLGGSLCYKRHLEKPEMEIGGCVGGHLGIPGVETTGLLGWELSERLHAHIAFGITLGKNRHGEDDILVGPLILGLGIRLN